MMMFRWFFAEVGSSGSFGMQKNEHRAFRIPNISFFVIDLSQLQLPVMIWRVNQ